MVASGTCRRLGLVSLAAFALLCFVSGTAFAYFKTTGAGSGSGKTAADLNVTVKAATAANDLFPDKAGTVKFTVTNSSSMTANFTSVTAASVTSGNPSGCPSNNILVASLPLSISKITVTPGQTTGTQTISTLISMSGTAPNACQGVAFTVSLTLSGQTS